MNYALALLATSLLAPFAALDAAEKPRPNILHIHADDHRADGLHALGTRESSAEFPNIKVSSADGKTLLESGTVKP